MGGPSVFAYNNVQCCNACVATEGCVGATFLTSSSDHTGLEAPYWKPSIGNGIILSGLYREYIVNIYRENI